MHIIRITYAKKSLFKIYCNRLHFYVTFDFQKYNLQLSKRLQHTVKHICKTLVPMAQAVTIMKNIIPNEPVIITDS